MKFFKQLPKQPVNRAFSMLESKDKKKLINLMLVQTTLAFLDIAGVVTIGALGALSIQGIEARKPGNRVGSFLHLLHIYGFSLKAQVLLLGICASGLLICKTAVSIYFTRRTFQFLSQKAAEISAKLVSAILSQDLTFVEKRSSQEILFIVTSGVNAVMNGILATSVNVASDIFMLAVMSISLLLIDPVVAISTITIFLCVGYFLHKLLEVRAQAIGNIGRILTIENNEKILEVLGSYRETVVRNRRSFYSQSIQILRYKLGRATAENSFMPYISKYVIESTTILGTLILASFEFSTKDAVHAVSILAVFMAASSRIAPAALRIQQGVLGIKNSLGSTQSTFQLIDETQNAPKLQDSNRLVDFTYDDFDPQILVSNLGFKYSEKDEFALTNINLSVASGSSVALVGPSGAGKTTLVDLILGVLTPQTGTITISGHSPAAASIRWAGGISYVPQNVFIASGTIRENVGLGYESEFITDDLVWAALNAASLDSVVSKMPSALDSLVGENGSRISGGQRQRLGIARALFTKPKLLVLDEATSALDGQTENAITQAIGQLAGRATLVIVAHRLSTVRYVDQVVYMSKGKIVAQGTFEEVRKAVPDFDQQAALMGI